MTEVVTEGRKVVDEALPVECRLSAQYGEALRWAAELHATQARKGTTIPYISHLAAVSGLVLEHGGSEVQAIAGLLHDAIEDTEVTAADIAERFGGEVAGIVEQCSDSDGVQKRAWLPRKIAYLQHLPTVPGDALLVSLADKVHNLRTLAEDVDRYGEGTLERFNGKSDGTRWYYRRLFDAYASQVDKLPVDAKGADGRQRPGAPGLLAEMEEALERLTATEEAADEYEATPAFRAASDDVAEDQR